MISTRRSLPKKLAEVVLAVLWLSAHGNDDNPRVWKGVDWDAMNLLFEKGWVDDPKSKSKSVALSSEGRVLAEAFYEKHLRKQV
jgi:hypothetical protein